MENIRLSFQGIWSHKMRSFLTMLGIIIGIASIIAIVSTINGTNLQIQNNLIGAGTNLVKIDIYNNDWQYEINYEGLPEKIYPVSADTMQKINDLPSVVVASAYTKRNEYDGNIFYNDTALVGCEVLGIDSSYFSTTNFYVKDGRNFNTEDYSNFRTVAIIDSATAESLFEGKDPIGQVIEMKSVPFTIIGVAEENSAFDPVINTMDDYYMYASGKTSKIFIPNSVWPTIYYYDEPENIVVKAASTEQMADAGKAVEDILNVGLSEEETIKYKAEDLLQRARELQELSNATNQQLIWIAGISLLVGGIGVMNIMLVSVTERTREIGLKKAIGAKKSKILWQFLTEAAVLTSLGGIIGVIAGIVMAEVISRIALTPVAVNIPSIIIAVAFSVVIGIVFGLLPSVKASNLNPIDALRHE